MFDLIYRGLQVVLLLMLSIMLSVTFIKLTTPPPIKMVSVDVSSMIKTFAKESSKLNLTEHQQKDLSRDFADALTRVNQAYGKKHHAIVLVSGAVVAGVEDVTSEIQAQVFNQIDFKIE
ncbi:TrbI F-type domain-containing protein [Fastidiosibacter lacustris]|uniref:TrbI F-type domain-containing protein n=1 Tax=Fastidiosibacter lacustris TaxID=2056695 RepID=UPI000E3573B6|nr:TrbI F-type domain-containing protein [Fastidiosibacter lacustris]